MVERRGAHRGQGRVEEVVQAMLDGKGEDLGPLMRAALEYGQGAEVLEVLGGAAEDSVRAIEELCREHYGQFVTAVDDLIEVQGIAKQLKDQVLAHNAAVQAAGVPLLQQLEALADAHQTVEGVREVQSLLGHCVGVLRLCLRAEDQVQAADYYGALKTNRELRGLWAAAQEALGGPGGGGASDNAVEAFIGAQVEGVGRGLEKSVAADFNEWLVQVRQAAAEVGTKAEEIAEEGRAQFTHLQAQQGAVLKLIEQKWDDRTGIAWSQIAKASSSGRLLLGNMSFQAPLEGVDFTPLYKCKHIQECLQRAAEFRSYYLEQRRLQLSSELDRFRGRPATFAAEFGALTTKVLGFFAVEHRVLATAPDLVAPADLDRLWDAASARLLEHLGARLPGLAGAKEVRALGASLAVQCDALLAYGRDVGALRAFLAGPCAEQFRRAALAGVGDACAALCEADSAAGFPPLRVASDAEWRSDVLAAGLAAFPEPPPGDYPRVLKCSLSVRRVSLLAVKALDDLAEFFAAVRCGPGNIAAVLGERERLQTALGAFKEELFAGPVSEAMLAMVRSEAHGPSQLLQLLANAFTLFQAYRNLDTYIARLGRDGPPGPEDDLGERLTPPAAEEPPAKTDVPARAMGALAAMYQAAEDMLVEVDVAKINSFVAQVALMDWRPKAPPVQGAGYAAKSEYIDDALVYLEVTFTTAVEMLPAAPCHAFQARLLDRCGATVLQALVGDAVEAFNMFALMQLDADVHCLEEFAGQWGLRGSCHRLGELRQILDLLLSGNPEGVLDTEARVSLYQSVDLARLAGILDKYREAPAFEGGQPGLGAGVGEWPKRAEMERVAKRLREKVAKDREAKEVPNLLRPQQVLTSVGDGLREGGARVSEGLQKVGASVGSVLGLGGGGGGGGEGEPGK